MEIDSLKDTFTLAKNRVNPVGFPRQEGTTEMKHRNFMAESHLAPTAIQGTEQEGRTLINKKVVYRVGKSADASC